MTELKLLQKIYDGEFALFLILSAILLLLCLWFKNRGGK